MFGDGALTFREFAMREPLPLATIHDAVLDFLRGRDDAALYGAQAVNAYVDEPRMTQDVDIMSTRGEALAEEIRRFLNERFKIATRIGTVRYGIGYRIYQVRKPKNRHLVDVRPVDALPVTQRVDEVLVLAPPQLIAAKILSTLGRSKTAKGLVDGADLRRLLLQFPELKQRTGPVRECIDEAAGTRDHQKAIDAWQSLVDEDIQPEDDADEFQ